MARAAHIVKRDGFSLVELLVVVAIVALLAALVLPGLARAREYAYFTKCKGHMRQIGLGFLTFAADNRGKMPLGDLHCPGGTTGVWGAHASIRRFGVGIGCYVGHWFDIGGVDNTGSYTMLRDIYMGPIRRWDAQNWAENISGSTCGGYTGRPRRPGKYLPVDILWDPIVVVRDWKPWGTDIPKTYGAYDSLDGTYKGNEYGKIASPGTEHGRDFLTRSRAGLWGYEMFTYSVGCKPKVHTLERFQGSAVDTTGEVGKAEEPFRFATGHKDMTAYHKPSAWIASCIRPVMNYKWCWRCTKIAKRDFSGHFGHREVIPQTYKFNVLHLDGHVDDELWMEYLNQSDDWIFTRTSGKGWMASPYGWRFKDPSGISGATKGIELIPGFPRAFDENR